MNKITLMHLENKGVEINVDENKSLIIWLLLLYFFQWQNISTPLFSRIFLMQCFMNLLIAEEYLETKKVIE